MVGWFARAVWEDMWQTFLDWFMTGSYLDGSMKGVRFILARSIILSVDWNTMKSRLIYLLIVHELVKLNVIVNFCPPPPPHPTRQKVILYSVCLLARSVRKWKSGRMSANIAKILWSLYSITSVEMQTCPFTDLYKRADPGLWGWGGGGGTVILGTITFLYIHSNHNYMYTS